MVDNFKAQVIRAILQYLLEKRSDRLGVIETISNNRISIRSLEGPPFELVAQIRIVNSSVICQRLGQTIYTIDLADPEMFDLLDKFVQKFD